MVLIVGGCLFGSVGRFGMRAVFVDAPPAGNLQPGWSGRGRGLEDPYVGYQMWVTAL